MAKAPTPESLIKRAVCHYLSGLKDCFFWVNESVGVFDAKRGIYRKKNSPYQLNGTADILGIFQGSPLAIEIKSKSGRLTDSQREFLDKFKYHGGIGVVARSVDDVKNALFPGGGAELW